MLAMIERNGLLWDGFKARFYDVQIPKPQTKEDERIVLSEKLLSEWDAKATEIVGCEAINNSERIGDRLYGAEEVPLSVLRVVHQDGSITIEPVYKLFPIGKHLIMRNTLLLYRNVKEDVKDCIRMNESSRNAPIRKQIPEWPVQKFTPTWIMQLRQMYCRKYDINMYQAENRTAGFDADNWWKEFDGKFDEDLCWQWCP